MAAGYDGLTGRSIEIARIHDRIDIHENGDYVNLMLVMITGGRTYADADAVDLALDALLINADIDQLVLMEGGAKGADTLARSWALARCVECLTFPADWKTYGRKAGFLRNRDMLEFGPPDLVITFPGGPGTADAVRQAEARAIRVIRIADGGKRDVVHDASV